MTASDNAAPEPQSQDAPPVSASTAPARGRASGSSGNRNRGSKGPDPFFWPVIVGFIPAILAAVDAKERTPSYALGSGIVYDLEVGLAVFAICYVVALIVCLAWQGRSFGRFELPGGAGAEPADPAEKIDAATNEVDDFQAEARQRFQRIDQSVASLDARLEGLETDQAVERKPWYARRARGRL